MRELECPGCGAVYAVAAAAARPGRRLRCFRCDRRWVLAGETQAPLEMTGVGVAGVEIAGVGVGALRAERAEGARTGDGTGSRSEERAGRLAGGRAGLRLAWAVSLVLVGGGAALWLGGAVHTGAAGWHQGAGAVASGRPLACQPSIPSGSQKTCR